MRVTGGVLKSRALVAPKGMDVRPTTDRVREALFSILLSQLGTLDGLAVLDLFAGTGALGLEAISRGATTAVFVEKDREAQKALARNLSLAEGIARTRVLSEDALRPRALRSIAEPFDLVFVDPPYRLYDDPPSWECLGETLADLRLAADALLILEHGKKQRPVLPGYETVAVRSYGDTGLLFLRR